MRVQPLLVLGAFLGVMLPAGAEAQAQRQPAPAQAPRVAGAASARRVGAATRTNQAPTMDGIPNERVWQDAAPLTDFVQSEPLEGATATEKTEVRLLYDDTYIYVGVICYDSDPSQIVVSDSRRDPSMTDMDSFQVIFDTYHDRQNGFIFGTNPAGAQYDAQVRNEGEIQSAGGAGPPQLGAGGGAAPGGGTNGSTSGSGAGINTNWDAAWDVKAQITEAGWTAEFRIPLRTLRYGSPPQLWGLNFARNIRRKRETEYWSPVSRAYNISRLSSAGDLRGLELKTPRNFKVAPYVVSTANRPYTGANAKAAVTKDWGLDTKYGVTPSLNLDLTYNTDFAQVEVDQQQINLTRFNLVFPEKRPFFLENAGLFTVGKTNEADLFYSRRIGIGDDGSLVPIVGGMRLTGKTGGVNVGVFNMQTGAVGRTPANNWTAVRVNSELPNRSRIGAIFTNRTSTGSSARPDDWGRTFGVDGKWGISRPLTFSGFAAKTEAPGTLTRQYAFDALIDYNTSLRRDYIEYTEVSQGFHPDLGFLQRVGGYRELSAQWNEHWRWKGIRDAGFRELNPHMSFVRYWNYEGGGLQSSTLHIDNHLDWENGYFWSPAINIDWDGLDRPFEIYPGVIVPPGRYTEPHTAWRLNTDTKEPFSAAVQWQYGRFLSGHENAIAPVFNFRSGAILVGALTWTHNAINLPQGAFVTNLGNLRLTYNFSTALFVQSLIQYNDRTNRWSTNLRFSWVDAAGTGLFVVYNDTEGLNGLGPVNRSFIVKLSRQMDVLR
jgi:uncharacterized protein DUF5916/cellulose/xylan binding protein with CBM9 domain